MNVEYLARQYEITPAVRGEVELGLTKLQKILGEIVASKVILTVEKHRFIAEITVKRRRGAIVGLAESTDMIAAVNQALDHIETQALKSNGRRRSTHRKAKDKSWTSPVEAEAYAKSVVQADFEESGDEDVVRKLLGDLVHAGLDVSEGDVREALEAKAVEAKRALMGEG